MVLEKRDRHCWGCHYAISYRFPVLYHAEGVDTSFIRSQEGISTVT